MSEPIKAADLVKRGPKLPARVIDAVNELLEQKFNGSYCRISQDEIIEAILNEIDALCTRDDVFNLGWLNFEPAYRNAGWVVKYRSPGYNESFAPYFEFSVEGS